jgi:galactokinase
LEDIYSNDENAIKEKHEPRYANLLKRFKDYYKAMPTHYIRAPGRVNIIGEHIDYCGYSVLPAAIEQDFVMAILLDDSEEITMANIDSVTFPAKTITTDPF